MNDIVVILKQLRLLSNSSLGFAFIISPFLSFLFLPNYPFMQILTSEHEKIGTLNESPSIRNAETARISIIMPYFDFVYLVLTPSA